MHYKFILSFFFLFTYFASLSAQTNWQQTAVAAEKEARKQDRLGNLDLTVIAYTKAFDLYQTNKDIRAVYIGYSLANALFKLNKVDDALVIADKIEAFTKNLNIDWLNLYAEIIYYETLNRRKQPEQAQIKFDAILARTAAINPQNAAETRLTISLNLWLAIALKTKNQFDLSKTLLNKADALSKNISETNTLLYAQVLRQRLIHSSQFQESDLIRETSSQLKKVADNLAEDGYIFHDICFYATWNLAHLNADTTAILASFQTAELFYGQYFANNNIQTAIFYLNYASSYKDVWRNILGYDINLRLPSILKSIELTKKAVHILSQPQNTHLVSYLSTAYRNMAFIMLEMMCRKIPIVLLKMMLRCMV